MAVRGIWVPVYPSMQNFGATVVQEASGAAKRGSSAMQSEFRRGGRAAGEAAGEATAAGLRAQQGAIERVSKQLAGARSAEADAAGAVRVAEAKLADVRNNTNSTATQLATAEESVARARRTHEARITGVATAERQLDEVREGSAGSSRVVIRAEQQLQAARDKVATANGNIRVAETNLNELRANGAPTARVAAAEEKLERARRSLTSASDEVTTGQLRLANAQRQAEQATEENTDAVEEQDRKFGISAETAAKWGAALGAAAVAVGTALFKVGSQFDDMGDALRLTGANGAQLDALNESAMRVAQTTPALDGGLEQIGQTMATLSQRLGLTGQPLETLTSQMVQLQNMGQEVDLNTVTGAMTSFGIKGADTSKTLDELFQVSQKTGLSITDLATSVGKGGPALRQYGLGIGESAALIGTLDRAGLDADKTMAAMTKGLSVFAKEGRKPKEALMETISGIKNFVSAGNDPQAIAMASKIFGTKGAAQFVDAVKSGAVSVESLNAAMAGGGDTILGAADDTADFAEQWQLFKQKALVAIEPIATRVFGIISQGMGWIADKGLPTLKSATDFMAKYKGAFLAVAAAIAVFVIPALTQYAIAQARSAGAATWSALTRVAGAWRTLGTALKSTAIAQWAMNSAVLANPITWIVVGLVAAGVALWAFFTKTETGRKLWATIWNGIKSAVAGVWNWLKGSVWPWLQSAFQNFGKWAMWLWNNAITPAFNGIKTAIGWVVDHWKLFAAGILVAMGPVGWIIGLLGFLQAKFGFVTGAIRLVGTVISWLWNNVAVPAFNGILAVVNLWWSGVQAVFGFFRAGLNIAGQVVLWLWNNVVVPAFNGIKSAIDLWWTGAQVVFNFFKSAIQAVGDTVGGVKTLVVNGFNAMVDFIKGLPGRIGNAAKGMWDGFKDAFKNAINWIIRGWNKIEFKIPGFKVGPVGYDGFTLGLPDIPELRAGGAVRDPNGRLHGPGTGTSDSILGVNARGVPVVRVSDDETVVTAKASSDPTNAAAMAFMNAGGSLADFGLLPKRAAGGKVQDTYGLPAGTNISYGGSGFPDWVTRVGNEHNVKPSTYAGHQESDRNEAGYAPNPQHLNRGIDWSGSVQAMQGWAEYLMNEVAPKNPALEQIIWMNPSTGQKLGWHGRTKDDGSYFASDYAGHQDHVHTRQSADFTIPQKTYSETNPYPTQTPGPDTVPTAPDINAGTNPSPDNGANQNTTTTTEADKLPTAGELVGKAATEQFDDLATFLGFKDTWLYDPNKLGIKTSKDSTTTDTSNQTQNQQTPQTTTDQPNNGSQSTPDEVVQTPGQPPKDAAPTVSYDPKAGAEQWRPMVEAALKKQGYPVNPAEVNAWVKQIDTESGGDPNIAQQIVDSNGTGEAAGVGLGQMIPTTWAAYRDPTLPDNRRDPWAMINGMVRYGHQKYGDGLLGVIGQGHGYDRGGMATGLGLMPKKILTPERVLSPAQTAAFEDMVEANFRPVVSNGSDVRVGTPSLGDDEKVTGGKRGRDGAPLVGTLQVQAIDVDDQVRRINRTLRDVAKSDAILGGWG